MGAVAELRTHSHGGSSSSCSSSRGGGSGSMWPGGAQQQPQQLDASGSLDSPVSPGTVARAVAACNAGDACSGNATPQRQPRNAAGSGSFASAVSTPEPVRGGHGHGVDEATLGGSSDGNSSAARVCTAAGACTASECVTCGVSDCAPVHGLLQEEQTLSATSASTTRPGHAQPAQDALSVQEVLCSSSEQTSAPVPQQQQQQQLEHGHGAARPASAFKWLACERPAHRKKPSPTETASARRGRAMMPAEAHLLR